MKEATNYNNNLIKIVEDILRLKKNKKCAILDFGSGSGTYADMLKIKGIKVDCLEPDIRLQKILKDKAYSVVSSINLLKPNQYDVIYSFNVFEHIKDDAEVVAKLQAALKANGRLIVYVPAFPILFSSMDKRVGHERRYKSIRLKKLALDNGFTINKLVYCDPIGFMAALAYRVLGKKDGVISPKSVRFYDHYLFPLSLRCEFFFRYIGGKNILMQATKK
jgi:SAM-dependent methyltransferase